MSRSISYLSARLAAGARAPPPGDRRWFCSSAARTGTLAEHENRGWGVDTALSVRWTHQRTRHPADIALASS